MSGEYQVIARKWRPQNFTDVVGQQHVVRTLQNAIRGGRTAHAYLFVGPRGVGKTTLARIFAKALNCQSPVDGNPCGQCESCRSITDESSLDVLEVDAASRNSTGDMRDLSADVLTSPVSGRYKIYIIDEVHMLSKAAWNVLLKTVEEPPPHVKFIFATTEVHQVLPTIISRCQRFDLLPIPTRLIAERLKLIAQSEKVAVSDAAIEAIARAAEGGMRDAQSLLDQMIAFFSGDGGEITGEQVLSLFGLTDRADLFELLKAMLGNDPATVVKIVSSLHKRGKNLETLFDEVLSALRNIGLCAILADPSELVDESAETLAQYRALASGVAAEIPRQLLELLAPSGRILREALNKQVLLETIILKAMREAHAVKLDAILKKLNQLRSAGELKFLDQVPKVEPAAPVFTPAPKPEPKPAPVPPPAPKPEPEPVPPPPAPKPEPKPAPVPPPAPKPEPKPAPAPPPAPKPEPKPAPVPPPAPKPEPKPVPPPPAPKPEVKPAPKKRPENSAAAEAAPTASPDGKRRVSIANAHPEAIRDAVRNDPGIRELTELFDGTVIDIHRPVGR